VDEPTDQAEVLTGQAEIEASEIDAGEIDESFVPTARADVVEVEIEGEKVLLAGSTGRVHWLDPVSAIVWDCLDGRSRLRDIIADLVDAFGGDPEVVRTDVLRFTREVGGAGLLEGVREQVHVPGSPGGLSPGTELPPFELSDLEGRTVTSKGLRGRRLLLVNWSPACGFCRQIAPDLGELQDPLRDRGIEMLLISIGDPEPNRELADEFGLRCPVLLQEEQVDLFDGLGTPAAYLIDQEGLIASELALGATLVPDLARSLL